MKKLLATALLISSALPLQVGTSHAFYTKEKFPACTSEKVIKRIVKRFNQTEKIYWEGRDLILNTVAEPHVHNDNATPHSSINRRYCHGDAIFENGKQRRIHFLIEEGAGFTGYTWNVEYCIHGLDPWKYHDGRCRVLSQ